MRSWIALALLFAISAHAGEPAPLTHEALWLMERVGAPVPSPYAQGFPPGT